MKLVEASQVGLLCILLALAAPGAARAQGRTGLATLLSELLGVVVLDNQEHAAHFTGEDQLRALNGAFVSAVGPQLATVPLGSPGGGLTFVLDESTGVFTRSSEAFGSVYSERALTIGRSAWNVGLSLQSADYDRFGEFTLAGGDVQFQMRHQDVAPFGEFGSPALEEDVIGARLDIDLSTETTVLFFTYGITDKFDVSVAVPFVRTELSARADLRINRLESGDDPGPRAHLFGPATVAAGGVTVVDADRAFATRSAAASGMGDILVRGKYRFRDAPGGGMAFAVDLRLATGAEEDLIGTGGTQARLFLIGSREWNRFSPHFNVGYTFSSAGGDVIQNLPDELGFGAGLLYAATPRVTIAADLIGRQLLDATSLVPVIQDLNLHQQPDPQQMFPPSLDEAPLPNVATVTDDVGILLGSLGVRSNPTKNLLVTVGVLMSLSNDGLEDSDPVPVVAVDYSF